MPAEYKIIGGDGREYGPVNLDEVRVWCEEGRVGIGTLVWREDERRWQPASSRQELCWDLPTAPTSPPPVAAPSGRWVNVGFGVRFVAWVIDLVLFDLLFTLATSPWSQELARINEAMAEQIGSAHPDMKVVMNSWLIFMGLVVPAGFLYHVSFNATQGATPGKRFVGIRILRGNGDPLTWKSAFIRRCAELLSTLTFGFGYFLVLILADHRALHDLLADTRVVRWREN